MAVKNEAALKIVQDALNADPTMPSGHLAALIGKSPRMIREWIQRGELKRPDSKPDGTPVYQGEVHRINYEGGSAYFESVDAPTQEIALERCGIDLNRWQVTKCEHRTYQVTMKLEETRGQEKTSTPYKATNHVWSFTFKPIADRFAVDAIRSLLEDFKPPKITKRKYKATDDPHVCMFGPHDDHWGMLAWGDQVGVSSDLKIQRKRADKCDETFLNKIAPYNISKFIIPLGNDLFHIDDQRMETPQSGNDLDHDGRPEKIMREVGKAYECRIARMLEVAPVEIVWVKGNHDPSMSFYLSMYLDAVFRNSEDVKVDLDDLRGRKSRKFGDVFLGFTHIVNPSKSAMLSTINTFMREFATDFAGCRWHDIFAGHFHHKRQKDLPPVMTSEDSDHGVHVRWQPSLSTPDRWHYDQKYTCNHMTAEAYLYSERYLEQYINIVVED